MPAPAPRRPIGRAIRRTDADRERLAQVTAADVVAARLLWHECAPPGWGGLIEAREDRGDERS
jgi:hypothetical protein